MRYKLFILFALVLCSGLMTGCRASDGFVYQRHEPPWVANPKRADSVYFYVVGLSTRQPSSVAAREAAFQNALYRISVQIANEAGLGLAALPPGGIFTPLEGAEILPDCVYLEQSFGYYNGYVQVSFPIVEKRKLVEKLRVE